MSYKKLSRRAKGRIVGSLFGDSSIHINHPNSYRYSITHSAKQKEYLEYKRNLFSKDLNCEFPEIRHEEKKDHYQLQKCHVIFGSSLYDLIYPNSIKTFTRKALNLLTNEGIAIWYMDDGSLCRKSDKCSTLRLHTCFLDIEEAYIVINYFSSRHNIEFRLEKQYDRRNGKTYYNVSIYNIPMIKKFMKIVEPYITVDCMKYKIL
jgi:hypothetical protein